MVSSLPLNPEDSPLRVFESVRSTKGPGQRLSRLVVAPRCCQ